MFYDLAGSTSIASRLDPEDLRDLMATFHRCVTREIDRLGGFVASYLGDGALVYFGYPQAQENDPERAIAAGLAAVEAVSRLTLFNGYKPHLRVGIATGLVVVGDILGSGSSPGRDIAGETPNLAARLQSSAEPDSILVSDTTRRLSGGLFKYIDVGELPLKGFLKPQRVWRVIGASAVDSRFEAQHEGGLTKLIGRRQEIALLLRSWRRARTGSGQVLLISGDAGIGKSRLASALLARLAHQPHVEVRYFCSPHQQESPLAPCISQLEHAAHIVPGDSPVRKLEKLRASLPAEGRHGQTLALFANLLSIPPEGGYPPLQLTPQQIRKRTLDVLVRQLKLLSRQHPVVVMFEDVHWIDPTSAELLDRMVDRAAQQRVLLVITFRPDFRAPWDGRPYVTSVSLMPLSHQQSTTLVDYVPCSTSLPGEVRDEIVTRADGIPLFLEELTKATVEAREGYGTESTSTDEQAHEIAVPATLQASLIARLDRLGEAREIAQIGAAIGREFPFELLHAVVQKDPAELRGALKRLADAGLVFRRDAPPGATFFFKHVLVQETAYSTLVRSTRREIHARIAETLERMPATAAAPPQLLAHHCENAGWLAKAAVWWLEAGRQALARSAMKEAAAQLQKGLDVLTRTPETPERDRCELEFQIAFGKVLIATKGYAVPITGRTFARARELCDRLNRPPQLVSVLFGQFTHALLRAELASAQNRADELLRLGEQHGQTDWQVLGYRACGVTCFPLGEFGEACNQLRRGLELFDPQHRPAFAQLIVDDVQVVMSYYLAWALLYLGHCDQARKLCDEALAEGRRLGQPFTLVHALVAWTQLRLVLLSFDEAEPAIAELQALADEHGMRYFMLTGSLFRGRCLAEQGREGEAIALLTRSLDTYRESGSLLYLPTFVTYLAQAYAKAGQPEKALEQLEQAAAVVERTQTRCDEADMHRLKGELLAGLGNVVGAEASFRAALSVARRQSAKIWELRAATALARLWSSQGRRDDGRTLLLSVRSRCSEGLDTIPVRRAEEMINSLM